MDRQNYIQEFFDLHARNVTLGCAATTTVITVFLAWWTLRPLAAAATSPHTQTTQGTITKLKLRKLPRTTRLAPTQCVELEYAYQVDGRELTGTRYRPGDTGPIAGLCLGELLTNYHIGDSVTVYYNPAQIADAILKPPHFERGSMGPLVCFVIFTVVLWVIGIVLTRYNPWAEYQT